jgi:uncharacterized membrane protein
MNAAHLHLLLNHLPIMGLLFGGLVLFSGLVFRNIVVRKTGLVSLVIAGLLVLPAFFTGEDAEHLLQDAVPSVEHSVIHEHEEAAELSLWLTLFAAATAAGTLFVNRNKETDLLNYLTLLATVIAFATLSNVAKLGGEIRHTEIRESNIEAPSRITPDSED